jgi:low temperature requirement protein LtrA
VLAASLTIQAALDAREASADLVPVLIGGLLTVFAMWWLYFAKPAERILRSNREGFRWGYGHLFIFASAAAVGSGLAVVVDQVTGHAVISAWGAGATITIPVALYLLAVWVLHLRPHHRASFQLVLFPGAVLLILGATFVAQPVLVTGLLMGALVAVSSAMAQRSAAR